MSLVLPDTNVLIEMVRNAAAVLEKEQRRWRFRISAVVCSELLRGANTPLERRYAASIAKASPPLAPTAKQWSECGDILRRLRRDRGYDGRGMQLVQNDVLIALTARGLGLPVVTTNRGDFDLVARELRELEVIDFPRFG